MATMSLAPNPASVEQTGDKLSILETRLNSLQQNISVIQPSKPTTNDTGAVQQQQDEASSLKANSLLVSNAMWSEVCVLDAHAFFCYFYLSTKMLLVGSN